MTLFRWVLQNWLRASLFLFVVLAASSVWHFDLQQHLTIQNAIEVEQALGWWAPLAFIVVFIIGEQIHIPSILWIFFAGLIWPVWIAIPVSLIAALVAATGAFLVARFFLGKQFHQKLPNRFKAMSGKIENNPIRATIVIRLTTFMHPLLHWMLAASPISVGAFIIGTFIGIIPATVALVLLGQQFVDWWEQYSLQIMVAVIVTLALIMYFRRNKDLTQSAGISE